MSLLRRSWADGERLEVAGGCVRLKINPRARRVSLRLDRARKEVIATAPSARRLPEAVEFARSRADWIARQLAALPETAQLTPGLCIDVFGRPVRLDAGSGRARWIEPEDGATPRIAAMGEGEGYQRAVILVLKRRALAVLSERTADYAGRLGVAAPTVSVADARTRWGSCRRGLKGGPAAIRYSWRLALAPFVVADYVVAHECAHLLEMNHSPRFWAHVRALVGDERPHRDWLRTEGAKLHAFGSQ